MLSIRGWGLTDDAVLLVEQPIAGRAIQVLHLIHDRTVHSLIHQILLLLIREFEHLASRGEPIQHLLVGQPGLVQGYDLIHGDKPVAVHVGGGCSAGISGGGGFGLCRLGGFLGRVRIFPENAIAIGADNVTSAGAQGAAENRAQKAIVFSSNRCARCRAAEAPNNGALLWFGAGQI